MVIVKTLAFVWGLWAGQCLFIYFKRQIQVEFSWNKDEILSGTKEFSREGRGK